MKKEQYIVQVSGIDNREYFYELIDNNYKLNKYFPKIIWYIVNFPLL